MEMGSDSVIEKMRREFEESARRELLALNKLQPGQPFTVIFKFGEIQTPDLKKQALLATPLLEYFSRENMVRVLGSEVGLTRIVNAIFNSQSFYRTNCEKTDEEALTLGDFLEVEGERSFLRTPNIGRKGVAILKAMLAHDDLKLRNKE